MAPVAWVVSGGAFVAPLVVPGPSSHDELRVAVHLAEELLGAPATKPYGYAAVVGDDDGPVWAVLVVEA